MERDERLSGIRNEDTRSEIRNEYERDLDRLLYTYHFRRLAEVTQVSSFDTGDPQAGFRQEALIHNRLTHSLKVGQVARRLTQYLLNDPRNLQGITVAGGVDENVVETAGRAHDLGHPPFGHIGEQVLDAFARDRGLPDGFEGNAQTFRILTSITNRFSSSSKGPIQGLDFTSASVAACVKYPWPRGESGKRWSKFGFVEPDRQKFEDLVAPRLPADPIAGTLEAQIMDWADDITYAVHDIEDFSMSGLIPLDLLAHRVESGEPSNPVFEAINDSEMRNFWSYAQLKLVAIDKPPDEEARRHFEHHASRFPRRPSDGSRHHAALVGRLASAIITETSQATSVSPDGRLVVTPHVRSMVDVLKQLTWYYVIDRPELAAIQIGQRKRLEAVCAALLGWVEAAFATHAWAAAGEQRALTGAEQQTNRNVLPAPLRDYVLDLLNANQGEGAYRADRKANLVRGVIDYVASLRELEVLVWYSRLCA